MSVSEAAVSGHVSALRKELGDELFVRTGSGISFTPGGLRLASRAVEMLGLQDQTRHEVRAAAGGQRVLRLGVSSLFGEYAAPGLIDRFSRRAADIGVEMSVSPPREVARLLSSRAIDAAIGPVGPSGSAVPTGPGSERSIRLTEFLRYQLVAVVGARHPLVGSRVSRTKMARFDWFLGPSAMDPASAAARLVAHCAVPEQRQRIFQNHAAALSEARSGRGIALCAAHRLSEEVTDGGLVRLDGAATMVDGTWATSTLQPPESGSLADEFVRFVATPRAIQAMVSGTGADVGRFRPRVHVTLWS